MARPSHQHYRYARACGLHHGGGAQPPRPRWRGGRVRRRRRGRAPVRDGVAPGRPLRRAPHLLHQQDGPGRRQLLRVGRQHPRAPRGQPRLHPAADRRRERLQGHGRPGADGGDHLHRRPRHHQHAQRDPRGHGRAGGRVPAHPARGRRGLRRRADDQVPRRRGPHRRRAGPRAAQWHRADQDRAGAVRQRAQEQGRAADARRRRRLPALAARQAGHRGPARRQAGDPPRQRRGPVLGAGLQDRHRSLRRQAHLLPGVQRRAAQRQLRVQRHQGRARARRPHPADARQPPRGDRGGARGRHRRRHRAAQDHHRGHALRRAAPDHPRVR